MPAGQNRKYENRNLSAARRHRVLVSLTDEQLAAAEGWRSAHGISEQSDALAELVRIGLLSEIAKIFRLVSDKTPQTTGQSDKTPETTLVAQ
jgi:hypothetical protein